MDHKLLAQVLADRLKKVIPRLVSTDHRAFVPGRLMGDNTLEIHAIISMSQQTDAGLLFVPIDFAKAFDSVDWKFLYAVLETMGFPDSYID